MGWGRGRWTEMKEGREEDREGAREGERGEREKTLIPSSSCQIASQRQCISTLRVNSFHFTLLLSTSYKRVVICYQ
jgi:hypothetical protein